MTEFDKLKIDNPERSNEQSLSEPHSKDVIPIPQLLAVPSFRYEQHIQDVDDVLFQETLSDFGLDDESIKDLTDQEKVTRLIDEYQTLICHDDPDKQPLARFIVLRLSFLIQESGVDAFIQSIDLQNTNSLKSVLLLESILRDLQMENYYESGSLTHQLFQIKSEVLNFADTSKSCHSNNYLAVLGTQYLSRYLSTEQLQYNPDDEHVFEISNGQYAVIDSDSFDVYFATQDQCIEYKNDPAKTEFDAYNVGYENDSVNLQEYLGDTIDFSSQDKIDFVYLHKEIFRSILKEKFSFELKDLSIEEQFYFLNYLKRVTVAEADRMKEFTATHGVDGMRTFLELGNTETGMDLSLGDEIIEFGEREAAPEVFSYYSKLLDQVNEVEDTITQVYQGADEAVPNDIQEQVRTKLLARASKVLKDALQAENDSDALATIQHAHESSLGFGEVFRVLKATGKVESVDDLNLEQRAVPGNELLADQDLLHEVEGLYRERYDTSTAEQHIANLHEQLQQAGASMHVYRLGGEVLATLLRVDNEATTYFGALNTSPDTDTKQLNLGQHLIRTEVERAAAEGNILEATATLDNARAYVNTNDFVIESVIASGSAGQPRFRLLRCDEWELPSHSMTRAQVKELYEITHHDDEPQGITEAAQIRVVRTKKQEPQPSAELTENFVCTKLVSDGEFHYFVLEAFSVPENARAQSQ